MAKSIILVALFFSGSASLIYEVIWTRELTLILGSSTYALSTMLSAFMSGLALGGWLGGKYADRIKKLSVFFVVLELGIGIFGSLLVPIVHSLSPVYFFLYHHFHLSLTSYLSIQFLLCFLLMVIPCALMGATFPLACKIVAKDISALGEDTGKIYSFNTLGSVLGSFSAGFFLIPLFGVKGSVYLAAGLNFLSAFLVLVLIIKERGKIIIAVASLLVGHFFFYRWFYSYTFTHYFAHVSTAVLFRNWAEFRGARERSRLLFLKEDLHGRVMVTNNGTCTVLYTGGKVEGSTGVDMSNQILLAELPYYYHPEAKKFLCVGLGTGTTLRTAALRNYQEIDCVEINKTVIEACKNFFYSELFEDERVRFILQDARNYLFLHPKRYDIISSEPPHPTEAEVNHLFTKEFFQLVKSRLNPGGIFVQWLPYYLLSRENVDMMVKTLGTVFPEIYVWQVMETGDLLLVAGEHLPCFSETDIVKEIAGFIWSYAYPRAINVSLRRTPDQVKEIVSRKFLPANSDNYPYLEFVSIRNRILGLEK